jgi:hypothetical protein
MRWCALPWMVRRWQRARWRIGQRRSGCCCSQRWWVGWVILLLGKLSCWHPHTSALGCNSPIRCQTALEGFGAVDASEMDASASVVSGTGYGKKDSVNHHVPPCVQRNHMPSKRGLNRSHRRSFVGGNLILGCLQLGDGGLRVRYSLLHCHQRCDDRGLLCLHRFKIGRCMAVVVGDCALLAHGQIAGPVVRFDGLVWMPPAHDGGRGGVTAA